MMSSSEITSSLNSRRSLCKRNLGFMIRMLRKIQARMEKWDTKNSKDEK